MTPTRRLIAILTALALSSILPALFVFLWPVWLVLLGSVVTVVIVDAIRLSTVKLSAERNAPRVIAHRHKTGIKVCVTNLGNTRLQVEAHDGHPAHCVVDNQPVLFPLSSNKSSTFKYRLQSNERGMQHFNDVQCRVRTSLGLLRRKITVPETTEVKVFPNFQVNRLFGLLLSRNSLTHMGIVKRQLQGEGSDFRQLREFRDGDSLRQIDWKATSRVRKLISREFQQERDQQIVFMLDCSMRMRHQGNESSHMDSALNALVLLANVALRQGDATGLMTFGGIERWIAPAKGPKAANRLVNGVYDIEATHEMPDYDAAIETLQKQVKRRALIILVTNLRNEDGKAAINALQRLSKKHVVLIADLREQDLDTVQQQPIESVNDAVQWLSIEGYRAERKQRHQIARAGGATLVDVLPEQLSASLITEYLAIKKLGRL